jgi:NAD(P)-dependent dehydrogenase (short-subunit alcohol dehydrogenase family)
MTSGSREGRLCGKTAIVTGAGRGIGKAIATRFAHEGARVMLAEIDAEAGDAATEELRNTGLTAQFHRTDVSDPAQVRELVSVTTEKFGGIDALVNNAAIASFPFKANLSDMPLDWWHTMMRANLDSVMLMSQAAAKVMIPRTGGYIVNVTSIMWIMGAPGLSAYQVAKGAVVSLTRSLAIDLAPFGIIVNGIAPGWIDTRHNVETMASEEWKRNYIASGRIPLRRPGKPEEMASLCLALCCGDASYMTGQTLIADGGMNLTL